MKICYWHPSKPFDRKATSGLATFGFGGCLKKNQKFGATFYVEKGCFPLQSLNIFGAETGPRKRGNSMAILAILMAFFRAASSTPTFRIRVCGIAPFRKFPVLKS